MAYNLIILAVIAWFTLFLVLGQNVATVLFGAGFLGIVLLLGPGVLNGLVGQDIFYGASTYSLSIIPLYLLMAQLLMRGGVIQDLFLVGYRMSGRRRFPLGAATLVVGGMLGAVSGSGAAAAATLATIAGPELEKLGYTKRFSIGLSAVAGSLSAVIPPSIIIIIYGSLTLIPVGQLFIGAFGPGILCMLVYIVCLRFFGEVTPGAVDGAAAPEGAAEDERGSLPAFIFVFALMFVIFGSIYGGVATAAEAGAVGAFTAMVGMGLMRRIGVRDVIVSLGDSAKITAMIMAIVLGAQIFGRFLSFSRLPRELLDLAQPMMAYPSVLIALILVLFFICGLFLESAAIMVLLVPVLMPMMIQLNVDMLWFGVMASFVISMGLLTPPVGLSVYAAASAAKVPVGQPFRSAFLFALIASVVVSTVMIFFPEIVTWLPSKMK